MSETTSVEFIGKPEHSEHPSALCGGAGRDRRKADMQSWFH
jgi:hypothetical protein